MEGVPLEVAREALRLAAHKLPMPTRFVSARGARMKATELRELDVATSSRRRRASCATSCSTRA